MCFSFRTHTPEASNICAFLSLTYWFSLAVPNRPLHFPFSVLLTKNISRFIPQRAHFATTFRMGASGAGDEGRGEKMFHAPPTTTTSAKRHRTENKYISCIEKKEKWKKYTLEIYMSAHWYVVSDKTTCSTLIDFSFCSLSSSSRPDIAPILNSYTRSEARWRRNTQPNDRTERFLSMNDQNCYGFFHSTLRANFWINFGTLQHLHNRSALFWILRSFSCRSSKSSCHYIWIISNAKLFSSPFIESFSSFRWRMFVEGADSLWWWFIYSIKNVKNKIN